MSFFRFSATCSRKKSGKGFLSKFGGFSALRPAIRANAHLNAALEMLRENRTFSARKCTRRCSSGGCGLSVQLIQIRRREICRRRHSDGQAGEVHALADNGTLCGGSLVRADVGDDENFRQVDGLDCVQRGLCILVACDQRHVRFEALADALVGAGSLPGGHFGIGERIVRIRLRHLVQQHVAAVVAVAVRHLEPDLVAGEREDGRKYLRHGIEDDPQRALRRAAGGGIRAVAVQAVLDDIEIAARKRHDAEIVDGVGAGQEFIVLIDRQF